MTVNQSSSTTTNRDPRYTITWEFLPQGWADGISEEPPPPSMPYLVDGAEIERQRAGGETTLTLYGLICGILLAWFDIPKTQGHQPSVHRFFRDLLEDYRVELEEDSLESLIRHAATGIRTDHGPLLASRLLNAGRAILPDSAAIRRDLMVDLWYGLETKADIDQKHAFQVIVDTYTRIDVDAPAGTVVALLDYLNFVALTFLGRREEATRFFWETASKRMANPVLKDKMLALREDENPDLANYRIWTEVVDENA